MPLLPPTLSPTLSPLSPAFSNCPHPTRSQPSTHSQSSSRGMIRHHQALLVLSALVVGLTASSALPAASLAAGPTTVWSLHNVCYGLTQQFGVAPARFLCSSAAASDQHILVDLASGKQLYDVHGLSNGMYFSFDGTKDLMFVCPTVFPKPPLQPAHYILTLPPAQFCRD